MPSLADQLSYRLGQRARVAVYGAAYLASQRLSGPLREDGEPAVQPRADVPTRTQLRAALEELFASDWANIAAGHYALPEGHTPDPVRLARDLAAYFEDLPAVTKRRRTKGHSEVLSEDTRELYPRYYLQNFHYQTDGWLSERSARVYDTQVEVLFTGAADAMRRHGLVPIAEAMAGRDQRAMRMADLACGTGRFARAVKENYPRLHMSCVDLSPFYLEEARRQLEGFSRVDFVRANVESLPFEDGSLDIASSVYLFHELPPKVRRTAIDEIARVLKPGGTFVLVDSIQLGDRPELNALLELFPMGFHEPYYMSYAQEDLGALFGAAGLEIGQTRLAFLTKAVAFRKG